ncbi:MAG TPA: cytochrome c [Nitrosospira sp.]
MKRSLLAAGSFLLVFQGASLELSEASAMRERAATAKPDAKATAKAAAPNSLKARGEYLARVGNCMGCHTAQDGRPYAGGRSLSTPFGTFVTPNITPDKATGIGKWSADDFWKAMHEGKSRDGRPLYPAFPYTEYTKVTREDSDAIFTHLQALRPVAQNNPPNQIKPPYNLQPLLSLWRSVYFKPGIYQPQPGKSAEWNRGAYLVQGLGHCSACHEERNPITGAWGAAGGETLGGGQIMGSNWYAPSLTSSQEAGTAEWRIEEIVQLLTTGVSARATTSGPMAEVIGHSLQYLTKEDARAMAVYLKSLSDNKTARPSKFMPLTRADASGSTAPALSEQVRDWLQQGAKIYKEHCEDCHGASGQGAPGVYPPLAGNRGVTMTPPVNAIRSILNGGYPPSTSGNPFPYGMPPFAQVLNDAEVALVLSYIRNAWGNGASLVTAEQIDKSREGMH